MVPKPFPWRAVAGVVQGQGMHVDARSAFDDQFAVRSVDDHGEGLLAEGAGPLQAGGGLGDDRHRTA
jgi:hypothetical protein